MTMPEYSLEEKALAFDRLWKQCGKGRPVFYKWRRYELPPRRVAIDRQEAIRVPVHHFTIAFDGDCDFFADVLHFLATKKDKL